MRQINTKFFLILAGSTVAVVGGVFALHRLQAGNIANALLWQASQAEKEGNPDKAARYLGRYLEFAPDDLEERSHLGTLLADPKYATTAKRVARGRFVLEQVLAKDPQRHQQRTALVRLAILARQLDYAREHLDYLKNKSPSGEVDFLEGELLELQDRSAAAGAAYRRAMQASPTMPEPYLHLVRLYRQADFGKALPDRKHTEDIKELVTTALQKIPHDPGILSLAAQVAQERGDAAEARTYLENGLKQNPADSQLYLALARIQGLDGKRGEAIQSLRRGLQEVGKAGKYELTWALANFLLDEGQLDEAEKAVAEVRELNPRSGEYLEARVQMLQGRWFEAAKALDRLRPHFQAVKELALQLDLYLGSCYEQLEEPSLQLAAYRRAEKTDPSSLTARRGQAMAHWALGQVAEALDKYQEIVRGNTDRKEAAQWRLEYARLLLQSRPKELAQVAAEIDEAEKELPGSVDVTLLRAALALRQPNQRAKAEAALRDAQREHPERFEPWVVLAGLAQGEGKSAEARALLREAESKLKDTAEFRIARIQFWAAQNGEDDEAALQRLENNLAMFAPREQARLLQTLAEVHYAASRLDDAGRLLRQMAELPQHAKDLRLRLQLLELAMQQKDEAAMATVLADMQKIEEGSPPLYARYGEAIRQIWLARTGRPNQLDEARQFLTAAAAQRPNWHAVTLARAEIDDMQGKTDQAIANYRLALDQGSRDPKVMKQLVYLLSQAQRYEEAEAVLQQIQQQQAARDGLERISAALAYNRKDYTRAANLLRQAMQSKSPHFRDHLWLGQVLSARGQANGEAEAAFRRAVELGPTQPEAWLGLVRFLVGNGQVEKAREELARAEQKLSPQTRDLALAQCHEMLGAAEEALKYYQRALQQQPDSAPVARSAADFYLRSGRLKEAQTQYRRLTGREMAASEQDVMRARRGLAQTLVRSGNPTQVAEALQLVGLSLDDKGGLAEGKRPDQPDEQLAQAQVLAALNNQRGRARAIALLEDLQLRRALQVEDQFLLARLLHLHASDAATWRKTKELLREIVESAPRSPRYVSFAAHLLLLNKEVPAAEPLIVSLEKLEQERQLPAGTLGSIELRARSLELRGQGAQAITLLQQFVEQKDAPAGRALLLAGLYGRLGQLKEAIDQCERLARNGVGEEVEAAHGSAVAILRSARHEDDAPSWRTEVTRVEGWLRAAATKDTRRIATRLQLADLMDLQGRADEVEKLCREVLAQDANNLVALNNLAWQLGQRPGRADEALTLIGRAIEKYGPLPELLDTRAVIHLSLGKSEQSLADLERVVKDAPTPGRYFHLSRAHQQAKNQPSALAALQRANELGLSVQQLHPLEHAAYREMLAEQRK